MAAYLRFAAIGIIAAALLAAACSGGDGAQAPDDPGLLLAPGRAHLSLCVDSAGGRDAADSDLATVEQALDDALAGLSTVPAEFGEPSVESGCPTPPEFTGERRGPVEMEYLAARQTTDEGSLSTHRIFVYFVPEDLFVAAYVGGRLAWEVSERLCKREPVTPDIEELRRQRPGLGNDAGEPNCRAMTYSVFVPDDAGSESVSEGILRVLGLHEGLPQPTTDFAICERNSAEPWCIHYEVCTVPPLQNPEYCEDFWTNQGAGLTPPPPIDTSAWPTFSSPLGFDIKYPPGWTVDDFGSTDFAFQRVRIRNELSQKEQEARSDEAPHGFVSLSGEAWIDIFPNPLPHFNETDLAAICGTDESRADNDARPVKETVDGRPAIRCIQSGEALGGVEQVDSNALWVEHPPGRSVHIGWTITGEDQDIIAAANAALATITFHE